MRCALNDLNAEMLNKKKNGLGANPGEQHIATSLTTYQ
jgi:hypothetical protein